MNPIIMPAPTNDQATFLRELVSDKKKPDRGKISGISSIAILSGKGGVGKSNLAVNLALAFAEKGLRMAVLDADLGLANIDILFGVIPKHNLGHVLRGEKELSDIVLNVSEKVFIIPGGAGLRELADLDEQQQSWVIGRLSILEDDIDMLLLDTSAGIHKNVLSFAVASDLTLLVTTPEPTSIRDCYSVLKSLLQSTDGHLQTALVVNMASDEEEARAVSKRIITAAEQFLGHKVSYLGCVLYDTAVREAVKKRRPLLLEGVDSVSGPCFRTLAERIFAVSKNGPKIEKKEAFLRRLTRVLSKKGTRSL